MKVVVDDQYQKGYSYRRTMPVGRRFTRDFNPELTPKQVLLLGVFGGMIFSPTTSEFPKHWFAKAKLSKKIYDVTCNYFGVPEIRTLSSWEKTKRGAIDPLGWFQWYCRYYMGRRIKDEDERQIQRFIAMKKYVDEIFKSCPAKDYSCKAKLRQTLLGWGYETRG